MRYLIFLLFISLNLFANIKSYNIDTLIVQALQKSPDINISKFDVSLSKQHYQQAFSALLPKVDFHTNITKIGSKEGLFLKENTTETLLKGTLTIDQLLYDFGKTSKNISATQEEINLQNETLKEQIILKKKDVKVAYYDILKNLALVAVQKENIKLNQAQLIRSQRYFKAGIRTKIDISDAKVRVIEAKMMLKQTKYNLETSYAVLDQVIGFTSINRNYKIIQKYFNVEGNISAILPSYDLSLEKSILYAYKNRPELKKYIYKIQIQKEFQKVANANYYPVLGFQGNYNNTHAKKYPKILDNDQYKFGIYMHWNLFHGWYDKAKKAEQRILTQKSISHYQKIKLLIKENVTKAYIALNKTKEDVLLSETLLKLSKEKFNQVSKQYVHGISDYIELQEARQGYINAKSNLIINYYNYYEAIAILDATIGR